MFVIFALASVGCGGGSPHSVSGSPSDPSNPSPTPSQPSAAFSVSAITPGSGALQIALNSAIQISFSSAADASTVDATNIKVTDPKPVAGTVSYDSDNNTATFTPSAALVANSTYTVTVSGVTSASGASLASPFTSAFATASASNSPGGSTGTDSTLQYQAPLFSSTTANGQVSIDASGNVTVQLTGATASTSFTVQFCPAFDASINQTAPACFNVTTLSTDASGNGSSTVEFPQPGNWAGDFQLMVDGKEQFITTLEPGVNGETFLATLEPETTTNGGTVTMTSSQSPLTSGAVTYANGTVTFAMTGASPNSMFTTTESETRYVGSSGTYELNTFSTDAQGDATSSAQLSGTGGDMLEALPQKSAGFIGGFSVPK